MNGVEMFFVWVGPHIYRVYVVDNKVHYEGNGPFVVVAKTPEKK